MASQRATSADVAAVAGVSRATVSYVLNDRTDKPVTDSTRNAVLQAAQQLGYHPSPAARILRTGRGDVVLVLLPAWDTAGEIGRLLASTGELLAENGLPLLRYEGAQWQGNLHEVLSYVTAACVVSFAPLTTDDQSALRNAGVPEARAWLLDGANHVHTTRLDQGDVVRAQIAHLMSQGCKQIIYVATHLDRDSAFAQARIDAFRKTCRSRRTRYKVIGEGHSQLDPSQLLTAVGGLQQKSGVCCFNDNAAAQVLIILKGSNLIIPTDVAVIGVDDLPVSPYLDPPLTSVKLNLGREAILIARDILQILGRTTSLPEIADESSLTVVRRSST